MEENHRGRSAVARTLNLDDDHMVQKPIEQSGRDDMIRWAGGPFDRKRFLRPTAVSA